MKPNIKDPGDAFACVVVSALVVLTAWGNAIALLAFSAIGLVAWLAVPSLRRQIGLRRGILAGAFSVAVAAGIAIVLCLSRSH